jgi:hypothetical protein
MAQDRSTWTIVDILSALSIQYIVGVLYMAFIMVISSTLILIPFMLYGLRLSSFGWTATDVALFGATIAATDAASVAAILSAGIWTCMFQ